MLVKHTTVKLILAMIVLIAPGCGEGNEFQPPPPPAVTVALPTRHDVVEYADFTGTTEVVRAVEIRARVTGVLQEVRFAPGSEVEAGAPLFLIDPAPFVATRDAAAAKVASEEAQLRLAETTADRTERSARDGAISDLQALEARAKADAAAASLVVAQRELAIKQLDVDYTNITAPISGRVERTPFGIGSLVGQTTDKALLTTIYDDSRIYVNFAVSDRVYLQALKRDSGNSEPPKIEIATEADTDYPFVGQIDYADPTVDAKTGTLRVRAVVDNPDRKLVGGLFVRVRLNVRTIENAMLVPRTAIGADQVGSYVLTVDAEGTVVRRNIELGPIDGENRVVTSGLSPDERVVIRGLLKARPGAKVNAQDAGS